MRQYALCQQLVRGMAESGDIGQGKGVRKGDLCIEGELCENGGFEAEQNLTLAFVGAFGDVVEHRVGFAGAMIIGVVDEG